MTRKLPVTVVVPTRNRAPKLQRLLRSLERMKRFPTEIIVVNDGSTDCTQNLLDRWASKKSDVDQIVVHIKKSKGPSNGRNQGIKAATQEVIAFTDDDVVVTEKWLYMISQKLIPRSKVMSTSSGNGRCCGVGGRVLPLRNDILSQYYSEQRILDPPEHLQYLVTANCSFLKSSLLDVGLFDTTFTFPGGEDTDLCLRLRRKGYTFARESNAIVYHDFSPRFQDFCRLWLRYGRGTSQAVARNR